MIAKLSIAEGVVEGDRVHHVLVPLERQQLLARQRVPHLAGAIVRAGDEAVARLVEGAVGERQDVRAEHLEEGELLPRRRAPQRLGGAGGGGMRAFGARPSQ